MKSSNISKIFFESSLIIFSVLLALILNEYREQIKEDRETGRALQMLQIELEGNLETLNKWLPYHKIVLQNVEQAIEASHQDLAFDNHYSYLMTLMPKGLMQSLLDDSAWQAVKQSNISSSLNLDTIFALSKLHATQKQGVIETLNRITIVLSSRELVSNNNLRETLFLMKNLFNEIVSQEIYLIYVYKRTIKDLKKSQS